MMLNENCSYRSLPKIDWCTLAFPILATTSQDLKILYYTLSKFFSPLKFEDNFKRLHLTGKADGIFIRIIPNSLSIQFQGHFFTMQENAFEKLRGLAKKLSVLLRQMYYPDNTDICMHVSRLDICQDFFNLLPDYFRDPIKKKEFFSFTSDYQDFQLLKKGTYTDTGFLFQNANWEISCYRKDIENEKQKKIDKKLKMMEFMPSDLPVTRFEIRLITSQYCLIPTCLLYDLTKSELDLCKLSLNEFYQGRKFRAWNQNDSHKNRWPENIIWRDLFIQNGKDMNLQEIVGIRKNEIRFNDEIAKRMMSKAANSLIKTAFKINEDNASNIFDKVVNKAKSEVQKMIEIDNAKTKSTERFYKRLKQSSNKEVA